MLIFAVDDEPKMLRLLVKAIKEAAPGAEVMDFPLGSAALRAIEEKGLRPEVVFSDIQMPRPDGLELAVRLKTLSPDTKIVFVTGYDDYAVEAYRLHASGYIMKPAEPGRIKEELENAAGPLPDEPDKLKVRCFGYFSVFWHNEPLTFSRKKTLELLAFLVDLRGAACYTEDAAAVIFEGADNEKNAMQNIRNLVSDLKSTLQSIGMGDVLIRSGSLLAIQPSKLDCDYYRMLEGDMAAVNEFRGAYMEQYSWAELTKGSLVFDSVDK